MMMMTMPNHHRRDNLAATKRRSIKTSSRKASAITVARKSRAHALDSKPNIGKSGPKTQNFPRTALSRSQDRKSTGNASVTRDIASDGTEIKVSPALPFEEEVGVGFYELVAQSGLVLIELYDTVKVVGQAVVQTCKLAWAVTCFAIVAGSWLWGFGKRVWSLVLN